MRFPTKDLTKQTDIGFSGEKAMSAHIEDTSLKNLMKETKICIGFKYVRILESFILAYRKNAKLF